MSVHVKTPTKTQFDFEHTQYPCGESDMSAFAMVGSTTELSSSALRTEKDIPFGLMDSGAEYSGGSCPQKRKFRERGGSFHTGNRKKQGRFHKCGEKNVLPNRFLLGGNITDPLNLNALYHDEFGKVLNEKTPQSSPLPLPDFKQQVQVIIPPNINDPLNLNAEEEPDASLTSPKYGSKRKKHKHNRKRRSTELANPQGDVQSGQIPRPAEIDISSVEGTKNSENREDRLDVKHDNKVVSPVLPPHPCKSHMKTPLDPPEGRPSNVNKSSIEIDKQDIKIHVALGAKHRKQAQSGPSQEQPRSKTHKPKNKFVYGNYDRYYGYRNPGEDQDNRLVCFRTEWFTGKDVLDIGCNIGHVTLTIARDYKPKRILGMDIDSKLISIAKKNIRHYMSSGITDTKRFPMSVTREPIAAPSVPSASTLHEFPHNVMFTQGNYILDDEDELELVQEEYDTILALSLTKWLHLNFGDNGLKRAFKRMHKQLRPGGRLILEPQSWASYKKKKKLTEVISKNFQGIRFRPEQFTEYLLSREVGFIACEHLESPFNKSQGFQRPLQVYTKSESHTTPAEGVTPLMEIVCTPCNTPQLSGGTPYVESVGTPHMEPSVGTPPMFDVMSSV